MTILQYITPSRIGGAETYFLTLVRDLSERGHRVLVVTKRDTPLRRELEKLHSPNIEFHFWRTHGKIDPFTLARLCRLIRRERVDLINTHLTTASWQGTLAGKLCDVPTVAVVHATDRKTFFQWADQLIAVSCGVQESLEKQGVPKTKIRRLYCGIDLQPPKAALPLQEAKAHLGLPPDARTVGVVASLIKRKGHRFLLQAMQDIESQTGPVHALFAGEGDQECALREQARALGLEDRVHFLGFRRDVPAVVSAMDIFVLPSLKEGLSIAVMEAMLLDRPVVATAIAGMPEVVRHEETGLLVPPCDTVLLGEALCRVFDHPDEAARMSKRARQLLAEQFEQSKCLAEAEAFLRDVVRHHREAQARRDTPHPATALKRGDLKKHLKRVIHQGKNYQSTVYLVEVNGQLAAVKDFAGTPRLFRRFVAPWLVGREIAALKHLEGFDGAPRLYARMDRLAFIMQYIEGTPVADFAPGDLSPDVFPRLQNVIDEMHERGVSHCDLKRRSNLLVTRQGEVVLIDFAAALIGNRKLRPLLNRLQREMVKVDNKALPRVKKFAAPHLMSDQERHLLENPTRLERWARKWFNR